MSDPQGRLTIGEFARATEISASALRFYHEAELLVPGEVDPVTGYRYYYGRQVSQALVLRHLRGAGLRLAEVRHLLAAPPQTVREVLGEHLAAMEDALRHARASAAAALTLLETGRPGVAVVTGDELADAVRRVSRAADRSPSGTEDLSVLSGVLIQVHDGELRVVASDRYRLMVQALPVADATDGGGDACAAVVVASALRRLQPWLRQQERVRLEFYRTRGLTDSQPGDVPGRLRLVSAREERDLDTVPAPFPDYQVMLDRLPEPCTRILACRRELLAATRGAGPGPMRWDADPEQGLRIIHADQGGRAASVDAEISGDGVVLGFDPARLRAVLAEGIGPDLAFEIARPHQPVVVRSADATGVTTLLMPAPVHPGTPAHDTTGAA